MIWPLLWGQETLVLRDTLNVHYPMKASQALAMRQGYLPLIDPHRAGGQPLLGNPNSVPLYPDNLLYLVAPALWALNAHFWIHLLLAPFAFYWLARAWGLGPPAAWVAGMAYATSGFFLSQLNLYNLVAGAALAPALVAASLQSQVGKDRSARRCLVAAGLVWALLLLAGDPMVAGQALLLALGAVLVRGWGRSRRLVPLALSLVAGTLLAAPQLVEFLRIVGLSYRGYWGFSPQWSLMASWNPATVVEWFVPLFFGRPDFYFFWGRSFFADHTPLFFSLYPGLLPLALVAAAGLPRTRVAAWSWGAAGLGLFLALGDVNPVVRALMELPGAGLLRFPVKMWLLVAVAGATLAGVGFEATVGRGRGRVLAWILWAVAGVYGLVWAVASFFPDAVELWMRDLIPKHYLETFVHNERQRWAGLLLLSVLVLVSLGVAAWLSRRWLQPAGAACAVIHVAAQLFFLGPLVPTDEAGPYRTTPPLMAFVKPGDRVAHGGYNNLFGESEGRVQFPDGRLLWVERRGWNELYPGAGVPHGVHYDLNVSPEGLDSFLTLATFQAMELLDDSQRVRVLAALGTNLLILDREIDPLARSQVDLRRRHPSFGQWVYLYEVRNAARPVQLVGRAYRAPHMNAALGRLIQPELDPRAEVVLAGRGLSLDGPPGEARVLAASPESLRVEVESSAPGVLVVARSYLPLYRASVDGLPARLQVANLSRLAVEVPAGTHQVRIWVDRRSLWLSLLGVPLGLLGLAALGGWRPRRGRHATAAPPQP